MKMARPLPTSPPKAKAKLNTATFLIHSPVNFFLSVSFHTLLLLFFSS